MRWHYYERGVFYGSKKAMSFMDYVPNRRLNDLTVAEDKNKTRKEIEGEIKHFLARGGSIQVIEIGEKKEKVNGKETGVTKMPDGTYRATLNGHLAGKGYYKSATSAADAVIKYQFKEGSLY